METKNTSVPALVQLVSSFLDAPVVDQTELKANYDVPLDFSVEDLRNGSKAAGVVVPSGYGPGALTYAAADSSSSIAASLRQADARKMQLHPHFLFNTLNAITAL